jgi:hypothetical protein
MERENKDITTPNGTKVVLRSYLTGREAASIKNLMLSSLKMTMSDVDSKKLDMGGLTGDVLAQQERKTLEYLLVSIDGDTENPVEKLLDMPSSEYDAVLKAVQNIQNPTTPAN